MLSVGSASALSLLSPIRHGNAELYPPAVAMDADEAEQNPRLARAQPLVQPVLAREDAQLFAQDYMQNEMPQGLTLEPFREMSEAYLGAAGAGLSTHELDVWA